MTSDKIQPSKHNADDAQSEKSKIEDTVAKLAVTRLYDELFMPPQYRNKSGNVAQEALGMFFSLEQAKNAALKKETHAPVPAKPPVTPAEVSRDKSPGLPLGPMAWITEGEDKVRNKLDAVGGFIGGKANDLGHSLNNAAKQAGVPKEIREATKVTIEFTSHAAGAIGGDIHEMSKIVYNPHDPAVRFAESWGGKPAAFSTSIFRSGQNLVTGIAGLGSSGVSELGKRGFMQDPLKAMYLGNRDLFVNGSVGFGKWETRAKAGDWGSLAGHGATFFVGLGEAVAGAKAVKALGQGKSFGEAAAVFSESSNVAKAGKATKEAVDRAAEPSGKTISPEAGKTAAEHAGDKLPKTTSDKLSATEKTFEDLSQINRRLEEARETHKELSRQLVRKQEKLGEVTDKREMVSRVLEKQELELENNKQCLATLGELDKLLEVTDLDAKLLLRRSPSPAFDVEAVSSLVQAKVEDIEQTMSCLGLPADAAYHPRSGQHIFQDFLYDSTRLKLPEQELKQVLRGLGLNIDEKALQLSKSSSGIKEKPLTEALPHSVQPGQELDLLFADTQVLRQKLDETSTQLGHEYRELNAQERLLRARNLESESASVRASIAWKEVSECKIHLDYSAAPGELDRIQTLAVVENRSAGTILEDGILKVPNGATLTVSKHDIEIKLPHEDTSEIDTFKYDLKSEKVTQLNSTDDLSYDPKLLRIKSLLVQNKMSLLNERLKLIAQDIVDAFDARPKETIPEDYYSF